MDSCKVTSINATHECFLHTMWCFLPTAWVVPPLAVPTNARVIRLLLSKPGVCSTSEIFVLHLAMFDTLFCLMIFTEYLILLCIQMYEAKGFLAWSLNHVGRPVLLCLLSLDCYMAVCQPVLYLRLKDPKLRPWLCLLVNVFTVTCCCVMAAFEKVKWTLVPALVILALAVTFTCNVLVLRSLRQKGPSGKEVHPMKRRAFSVVLTSFLLMILHYSPTLLELTLKNVLPQVFYPISYLTCVSVTCLSMSSVVQPLCYLTNTNKLPKMGRWHCGGKKTRAARSSGEEPKPEIDRSS